MAKRVSSAQAKAQLSALLARVAYAGEHFVIERRGKPMAALVHVDDLKKVEQEEPKEEKQEQGFLALVGAWGDILTDEEIDAFIADVYAARERDHGRPVDLED